MQRRGRGVASANRAIKVQVEQLNTAVEVQVEQLNTAVTAKNVDLQGLIQEETA